VPNPKGKTTTGVVEREQGVIEETVIKFIADYLESHMRPDQQWLFESAKGRHLSNSHASRIFGTYCRRAGLSAKYSFHALRHGRGVKLWRESRDLALVAEGLRHRSMQSSQRYVHLDPEERDEYRKRLGARAFDPLKDLKGRST
jgi:site-specific recombinase XerD